MGGKFISRSEEFLLLAVWRLKENAYGVTIRNQIKAALKKKAFSHPILQSLHPNVGEKASAFFG